MAHDIVVGIGVIALATGVVSTGTEAQRSGRQSQWELVRQIGVEMGPEEYSFERIGAVTILPTGTIVVTDLGAADVRFFDAEGRFLKTVGGSGAGPGEFAMPLRLQVDSVLRVFDPAQNRVVILTLAGEHVATKPLTGTRGMNVTSVFELPEGILLGRTTPALSLGGPAHQADVLVFAVYEDDTILDTVATYHSGATIWHATGARAPWGIAPDVLGAGGAVAVAGEAVWEVDGYRGTLTRWGVVAGRLRPLDSISYGLRARPVSREDLEMMESALRRMYEEFGRALPRRLTFVPPPARSVGSNLLVTPAGVPWVKVADSADTEEWLEIRGAGDTIRHRFDGGFDLHAVRDRLAVGTVRTELEAELVQVLQRVR